MNISKPPWKCELIQDGTLYALSDAEGKLLALINPMNVAFVAPTAEDFRRAKANGTLMAAAPFLLQALEASGIRRPTAANPAILQRCWCQTNVICINQHQCLQARLAIHAAKETKP